MNLPARPASDGKARPGRKLLGIDYGRKRIGLATADETGLVVKPLRTLVRKNRREDLKRLREVVEEHGIGKIVVGHPLRLDGTPGEMAEETARFAERLRKALRIPVELADERLSSWEASQMVREKQTGKRSAKEMDAVAAAVILRDYLNREHEREEE
jgi:putative Holliday junction resolvase